MADRSRACERFEQFRLYRRRDLLADSRWTDQIDNDNNGYADDLFGWILSTTTTTRSTIKGTARMWPAFWGAMGNNGVGVSGVAWATSIVPLKFLNSENLGDTANAIRK